MIQQQPRVLVLGANGRLGRALVVAFATAGWRVRAQMRNPQPWQRKIWPNGVEPWFCDATEAAAVCRAAEGSEVLVNALNPLYSEWKHNALLLSENALSAARASGALLMFPGNVYNFGKHLPESLHETTLQVGNTNKGQIRITMEAALHAAAGDGVNCVFRRR